MTVSVDGKIDGATSPELESRLVEWLDQGETKIILDLQEVFYISSAGLRVVLFEARSPFKQRPPGAGRPQTRGEGNLRDGRF